MSNEKTDKAAKSAKAPAAPKYPTVERKGNAEITRRPNGLVITNFVPEVK